VREDTKRARRKFERHLQEMGRLQEGCEYRIRCERALHMCSSQSPFLTSKVRMINIAHIINTVQGTASYTVTALSAGAE
jgi:ABC-type dipeptide/oligopeptide/nickel transport system ATPase component